MSALKYSRLEPRFSSSTDYRDIGEFFHRAHQLTAGQNSTLIVELQPGDGTRYRACFARDWNACVFTGMVPAVVAFEYDLDGPAPDECDEPFCGLNPWTRAIYVDLVRAVLFHTIEERRYDYENAQPRSKGARPC